MNILHIYDYMLLGGAETNIITLSNELNALGQNSFILSSSGPAVKMIDKKNKYFIEQENIFEKNNFYRSMHKTLNIIRDYKIDIIHAHPFVSAQLGILCGLITNIPVVTTMHSKYCVNFLRDEILNKIDAIICISKETFDELLYRKIDNSKISIIPNSVAVTAEPCIKNFYKEQKVHLLYVSRIDDDKFISIKNLLETIIDLKSILNIELVIIGEGNRAEDLSKIVDEINNNSEDDYINYIGGKSDVNNYIDMADIVIGVGRVILEAIAMGKFAICIGEEKYPGIVDRSKFEKISKVNFTDRNTSIIFSKDYLISDICDLYYNFESNYCDLEDTYEHLKENFNIKYSSLRHIELYDSVIKNRRSNSLDINKLQ